MDVVGGISIKNIYTEKALALFIAPPSLEILHQRLKNRGTDSPEMIEKRISKADLEMTFSTKFDKVIVNDDLEKAKFEVEQIIRDFLRK